MLHPFLGSFYGLRPTQTIETAQKWVQHFVDWYNNTHRHSQIGFVTPAQKHRGEDLLLMQNRREIYESC